MIALTPAQWTVLRNLASAGEVAAANVNPRTLAALRAHDLIEECPRHFYGPRSLRYRASERGRELLDARRPRRNAAPLEADEVRALIDALRTQLQVAELTLFRAGWREVSSRLYDARIQLGHVREDIA